MSDFISSFSSYFTETEQKSEIFQIWATIGTNVESDVVAEVRSILNEMTDYSSMTDERLRSLLAFFYVKVRNYTAASGDATVEINASSADVSIPAGSLLLAEGGIIYEQEEDVVLKQGQSADFAITQGETETSTGVFSEFIALTVDGVDLDTITLTIGGTEVPMLDEEITSFPYGGFFPAYYNGILYIKVFSGDDVPSPNGLTYVLNYRTCVGYQGRIGMNTITTYQDEILDIDGNEVTYTLSNSAVTSGENSPPKYEIVNLLRYWLFVKASVASIPEYETWFLSQPEVGDVKIISDYSKWVTTGVVTVTGVTEAVLMDKNGDALSETTTAELEARLALVRDVGVTTYSEFTVVLHYYLLRVKSAYDLDLYRQTAITSIQNFYNITFEKNRGSSLFSSLDLNTVKATFRDDLLPVGSQLEPYHYAEQNIVAGQSSVVFTTYSGELPRGYYKYEYTLEEVDYTETWTEYLDVSGSLRIYNESQELVGQNLLDDNLVVFTYAFANDGVLKAYWPIEDNEYVPVGASLAKRELQTVDFEVY